MKGGKQHDVATTEQVGLTRVRDLALEDDTGHGLLFDVGANRFELWA